MSNSKDDVRYFIVQREDLGAYGNINGSDKAEAQRLLSESPEMVGDLVIIRGVMIKPTFNLE